MTPGRFAVAASLWTGKLALGKMPAMEPLSRRHAACLLAAGAAGWALAWPARAAHAEAVVDLVGAGGAVTDVGLPPSPAAAVGDVLPAAKGLERLYVQRLVDDPALDSVYAHAGPDTSSDVVGSIPYGTPVPVLGEADGQKLWYGGTTWYKVALTYGAGFLYAPLLDQQPNSPVAPPLPPPVPRPAQTPPAVGAGQSIVVSLADQFLWAFDGDQIALAVGCTTGGKGLETPAGDYTVKQHVRDYTFNSPWPKGSNFWYPTVQASYALLFYEHGYFLHDAPWRRVFGPDSQGGSGPLGHDHTGSHGCVNLPYPAAQFLFGWAADGTPVKVF